jgi:hypothetical protein
MPKFKGKQSRSRSPGGPRGGGTGGGFCDTSLVPRVEELAKTGDDLSDVVGLALWLHGPYRLSSTPHRLSSSGVVYHTPYKRCPLPASGWLHGVWFFTQNNVKSEKCIQPYIKDAVVTHLRGCYREYLRKPMLIFRKGVAKAIEVVRKRGGAPDIESLEAAHLQRRGLKMGEDDDDESDDDDDDDDEGEGEEEGEEGESGDESDSDSLEGQGLSDDDSEDEARKMDVGADADAPGADTDDKNGMNGNLSKLYSGGGGGGGGGGGEKAAFAAPHLVAAAAQRALAAEAAEKAAKEGGAGAGAQSAAAGGGAVATANGVGGAAAPVTTTPGKDATGAAAAAAPPMSAAEAGHIAAMATARAARLKEIEQSKNRGGKNNKKGKGGNGNKRKRGGAGGGGGAEFGEDDFMEDYLPGGKKYRKGGSGNGPGDPFGLAGEGGAAAGAGNLATPSAPRNVRLADLGGIEESLKDIRELILCPLVHPELYSWLGVDPPRGVLLHGEWMAPQWRVPRRPVTRARFFFPYIFSLPPPKDVMIGMPLKFCDDSTIFSKHSLQSSLILPPRPHARLVKRKHTRGTGTVYWLI